MEDTENEQEYKRAKDRSPSPAIKSTAVVKYTSVQCPVDYARLQCNTDLNLPPSNWGAALDSYGLKQILTRGTGLSSFRMAHMFPDCVGEVDVISGADSIKKLLKLPYQPNGTVSMIVHRVENTLLLDELDVYDYLMKSEWSWLKDFFKENVLKTMSEQERMTLMIENKSSSALQLTSKFLLHSVASLPETIPLPKPSPVCLPGPHLPEPEAIQSESPPNEHLYNRNVLWTFEDIQMLIGSDLPIFGGNDRPCVSLRLRDAKEPINVLTGIDYWLDNLMCNVPEVLMCYHLDGIVQKYEPMKTEDLPNLENSKFSPKVVRNVAQNILSFLKSNATKAGHTYWLFKGPDDDVVKLYDLTSLCPESVDNPFTTPVAMLLYRVARNMRLMNRSKHVKQLLEHAIQLLKVESHPQIVASSHYMLADLYVPATTNPANPEFKEDSSSDTEEEEDLPSGEGDASIVARGLDLRNIGHTATNHRKSKKSKPSELGGAPSRCGVALAHARRGLRALLTPRHHTEERERIKQQIISEEQHPKMANPYEPIKMDYEPLNREEKKEQKEHQSRSRRKKRDRKNSEKTKNLQLETKSNVDKNAILIHKKTKVYPVFTDPNRDDNFAWKLHLKTLLYEKICLTYATLAEYSYSNEQYGFSLKYIDMASKCQKLLSNMIIKSRVVDASCLIGRVGDNYFQLSKNWNKIDQFKKQFDTDHETDAQLRAEIENDMEEEVDGVPNDEFDIDIKIPENEIDAMLNSCAYYKKAIAVTASERRHETLRRLASVLNELGVKYMNEAQQLYIQYLKETEESETEKGKILLKQFNNYSLRSWDCLTEAAEIFERVQDAANLALLYCNKGRYMRFKAYCSKGGFSTQKRSLYSRADELYSSALKLLPPRGGGGLRELVSWERSCHLYATATALQDSDHGPEVSEVSSALQSALRSCELGAGPRQVPYQFRAAMIHHRLGSLYHAQYRSSSEASVRRRGLQSSSATHYESAACLLAALEDAHLYLAVRMEHVALCEGQARVSPNLKLKSLQTALQLLRQTHSMMKIMKDREPDDHRPKAEDTDDRSMTTEQSLLQLFEGRLHYILKSLIQYCRSKSNKDYEKLTELYKKMYSISLKIKKDDDIRLFAASICDVLEAMDEISKDSE